MSRRVNGTNHEDTSSPHHPALLQAVGLCRSAGNCVLLDDVSLSIRGGDRIAIVGPTGSGKTLLLRSLAMLDRIDAGELRWHGKRMRRNEIPTLRSQVVYLQQRPTLLEGTVEDNLRHPFTLRNHKDKRFDRGRIAEWLSLLNRDDSFLQKSQRDLSGGELQFTALLRAIQIEPRVLLLDEPTAALDSASTKAVETLVTKWLDEMPSARATVWVTHNHEQAVHVSESVFQVSNGKLSRGDYG